MSNHAKRNDVMSIVQAYSGRQNIIPIPRVYLKLTGDYASAALLNQILYWSERTTDPDGWFYKSYAEWEEELELSQYQIKRIIEGDKRSKKTICLKDLGVETTLKKSKKGAPTIHYRIDETVFMKALMGIIGSEPQSESHSPQQTITDNATNPIMNIVDNPSSTMLTNDSEQCQQSLRTEITTKTTTDIISAVAEAQPASQESKPSENDLSDVSAKDAKQLIYVYKSYSKNADSSMFGWALADAKKLFQSNITPDDIKAWYSERSQDDWVIKNINGVPSWRMMVSEVIAYRDKNKAQSSKSKTVLTVNPNERGMIYDGAGEGVIRFDWVEDSA